MCMHVYSTECSEILQILCLDMFEIVSFFVSKQNTLELIFCKLRGLLQLNQ